MKEEALRLALEALGHFEKAGLATLKTIDAITAIKQALKQSVADSNTLKEPVAKIEKQQHDPVAWTDIDFTDIYISELVAKEKNANVPLYTFLRKRDWVGLTNEEFADILCDDRWQNRPESMMLQVQAKLKERNT